MHQLSLVACMHACMQSATHEPQHQQRKRKRRTLVQGHFFSQIIKTCTQCSHKNINGKKLKKKKVRSSKREYSIDHRVGWGHNIKLRCTIQLHILKDGFGTNTIQLVGVMRECSHKPCAPTKVPLSLSRNVTCWIE